MILSTLNMEEPYRSRLNLAVGNWEILHARLHTLSEAQLSGVEILLTYGHDVPEDVIDRMPRLRWIHVAQSGLELLPMDALRRRNIAVTNSKGINAIAISEYVLSMMLNIVRKSFTFYDAQKEARWDCDTQLDELYGMTVAILGLGAAGQAVAKRAEAFGMRVLGMKTSRAPVRHVAEVFTPEQRMDLLAQADFIAICLPLTAETLHLLGDAAFAAMKKTAWLINVGRGEIIDMSALERALRNRTIAGAVLDVFALEPLSAASPLWRCPNVYITPHIAGDRTPAYMPRMINIFTENLKAYPKLGQMVNRVEGLRGY